MGCLLSPAPAAPGDGTWGYWRRPARWAQAPLPASHVGRLSHPPPQNRQHRQARLCSQSGWGFLSLANGMALRAKGQRGTLCGKTRRSKRSLEASPCPSCRTMTGVTTALEMAGQAIYLHVLQCSGQHGSEGPDLDARLDPWNYTGHHRSISPGSHSRLEPPLPMALVFFLVGPGRTPSNSNWEL